MRVTIKILPLKERISLPIHYNYIIQSFIYRNLKKSIAREIHKKGYPFQKRIFRLFTFSRLLSSHFSIQNGRITFTGPFYLKISSLHENFLQSFVTHLLKSPEVNLSGKKCMVESVEINSTPQPSFPLKIKTLSPITTYSTLYTKESKKKTYYYNPWEKEFSTLILENLKKKLKAWKKEEIPFLPQHYLKPLKVSRKDEKIIIYKDHIIKGWMGTYNLNIPKEYFPIAYDAGLGSKNSQGFGMIEAIEKSNKYSILQK